MYYHESFLCLTHTVFKWTANIRFNLHKGTTMEDIKSLIKTIVMESQCEQVRSGDFSISISGNNAKVTAIANRSMRLAGQTDASPGEFVDTLLAASEVVLLERLCERLKREVALLERHCERLRWELAAMLVESREKNCGFESDSD